MENKNEKLNDQQMKDVTGGINAASFKTEIYNTPESFYTSEKTPKYAVDQEVKIKAQRNGRNYYLPCKVVRVSDTATAGFILKEFLYSVEILTNELDIYDKLSGKVFNNIYESCLYE